MEDSGGTGLLGSENPVALANSEPGKLVSLLTNGDGSIQREASPAECRALALAYRVLGELQASIAAAAEGRTRALQLDDQRAAAMCILTSSPVLAQLGRVDEALELLDASEPHLRGLDAAELRFQRAGIFGLIADYRPARAEYTKALRSFRQHDMLIWQGDALMNRGLMSAYLGDVSAARRDLLAARDIFAAEGDTAGVAGAVHNLALADLISGHPVAALLGFESSHELFDEAEIPYDTFLADHAEALLTVGLYSEATDLLGTAIEALESSDHALEAATQRLLLAQAYLSRQKHDAARSQIAAAARAFADHGQLHRAKRATLTKLSADLAAREDPGQVVTEAKELAHYFGAQADLPDWYVDACLLHARALQTDGRVQQAQQLLTSLGKRNLSFLQRVERTRIAAEGHQIAADGGSALRSARRGLRLVENARSEAPSSEVHDALSQHLVAFGQIGLQQLLASGRASDALDLAEQVAQAHKIIDQPNAPSAELIEYRALSRAALEAENEGRDSAPLRRRQRRLTYAIRRSQSQAGRKRAWPKAPRSETAARRYVVTDGRLWAIDRRQGRTLAIELCDVSQVARTAREVFFRVRASLAGADPVPLERSAAELDALIGLPGSVAEDGEKLILSADSTVPLIPYGFLPSLDRRPWVIGSDSTTSPVVAGLPKQSVVIAGPDLKFAESEQHRIVEHYTETGQPRPTHLSPNEATAEMVSAAMDGAGIVHIAAHSSVNQENPLFSSIRLAEGDFTLHALSGLAKPPRVVVLASCESAGSLPVGTTTVGLTSGLLRLGVGAAIGTACVIPDSAETVELMTSLHHHDLSDVGAAVDAARRASATSSQRLVAQCLMPSV